MSTSPLRRDWRNLWPWLILTPAALAILIASGQAALWSVSPPPPADTRSQLHADYAPWPYQTILPVSTALVNEIRRERTRTPEAAAEEYLRAAECAASRG